MALLTRIIAIDYSGAQTPTAILPGLCVYLAAGNALAERGLGRRE